MSTKYFLIYIIFFVFSGLVSRAESGEGKFGEDSLQLRRIADHALTRSSTYAWLAELCEQIGPRLSGSTGAEQAVQWAFNKLQAMGLDSVWLQPVMVPHWDRGKPERAAMHLSDGRRETLQVCALGGSVATPSGGIRAPVVELFRLEDLERLGRDKIEGRIVLFNRPMEPRLINTFDAYGSCVDQRSSGAKEAAQYGAVAVLVRSMSLRMDDLPHTGTMSYAEGRDSIPAAALSTNSAAALSRALRLDPSLEVELEMFCRNHPDALSHNVIAELRGSEFPEEIILVSGHLDSWDLGQGAHDDGAGCVQSMAVMESLLALEMRPRRSIRCVLFMNEENGQRGAARYAEQSALEGLRHLAALESDRGGFSPRGFSVDGAEGVRQVALAALTNRLDLLAPYGLHFAAYGHAGVDISHLKDQQVALFGLVPDSQRYFDYHHAASDLFETVNKRELELGTAAMSALIYLLDRYGLPADVSRPVIR